MAAAHLAKVDRVVTIGGAQAVAALAHGADTVLPVDKIVGRNSWVANAKRQVFGKVGIDMIAGPSEILVYVEPPMDPDWVAMDLLSLPNTMKMRSQSSCTAINRSLIRFMNQ